MGGPGTLAPVTPGAADVGRHFAETAPRCRVASPPRGPATVEPVVTPTISHESRRPASGVAMSCAPRPGARTVCGPRIQRVERPRPSAGSWIQPNRWALGLSSRARLAAHAQGTPEGCCPPGSLSLLRSDFGSLHRRPSASDEGFRRLDREFGRVCRVRRFDEARFNQARPARARRAADEHDERVTAVVELHFG